ncbi:hypothetical protein [uncultured Roseobacter sp.]|uniref:hypothetical protein n=1 Tax=uncultured Roseobacter sp. TaxID=114847 RepID=UPI0026039709|nr:hypothetical protein [uncultured Roseobacter sp.]
MRRILSLIFGATCLAPLPLTAAETEPMPLTYAVFEASVPHVDLETCPEGMAGEDIFCRATLAHEELHIFAFATDGDSPLVGFASFDAERLPELLN